MECIFCKFAAGEIKPAGVLFENENAMAFLDVRPRSPGHTLVIPKVHAATIADLDDNLIGPVFSAVQEVSRRIRRALKPTGISVGINDGAGADQEVAHLHVHLMPRFPGDGGRAVQSLVQNPPEEALESMAKRIVGA